MLFPVCTMTTENEKIRPFPGSKKPGEPASTPVSAPAADAVAAPAAPAKPRNRRKLIVPVLVLLAAGGAGWFGYNYMTTGRYMVSTDDAYILGDITTVSPKVMGYVKTVNVVANQQVHAGDALVTLDDGDYRIARDQAQASIDNLSLTLARYDAQIKSAQTAVTQAEAQKAALEAAQRNATQAFDRSTELNARKVVAQSDLDSAVAALDQANANLAAGDAQIAAAEANVAVVEAQRAEAAGSLSTQKLLLEKAERDMSFTVLRAPYDGVVGNMAVQTGDLVGVGARLAAIVPVDALYIEANFKETQLAQLAPGEHVKIHVDALEEGTIEGTIQSLAPASGSVFSLLPAENATGNFTKVVQRVPVRIALPPEALATGHLRAGLSVVVEADTRTIPQN